MGFSHLVHAGGNVLTAFVGFSTQQKAERNCLVREIKTYCTMLQPHGSIDFNWSVQPLGAQSTKDSPPRKYCRYKCVVCWHRKTSIFDRSPGPLDASGGSTYVAIFEAEVMMPVRHFWEPYQREPRWEVQTTVLGSLRDKVINAAEERWGPSFLQKMLLRAQSKDVVMDEKLAYLTMHSMGGFDSGGRWKYVPKSLEGELTSEQEYPQINPYTEEKFHRWQEAMRDIDARQLEWKEMNTAQPMPKRRISTRRRLPWTEEGYESTSDSEGIYRARVPLRRTSMRSSRPEGYGPHGRIYGPPSGGPPQRSYFESHDRPRQYRKSAYYGDTNRSGSPRLSHPSEQGVSQAKKRKKTHVRPTNRHSRGIGPGKVIPIEEDDDCSEIIKPRGRSRAEVPPRLAITEGLTSAPSHELT